MRWYITKGGKFWSSAGWGAQEDACWFSSQVDAGAAMRMEHRTRPRAMEGATVASMMPPAETPGGGGVIGNGDPFSGF